MLQEIWQKNHNPNILSYCESVLMYIEVQIKRHIMYIVKVQQRLFTSTTTDQSLFMSLQSSWFPLLIAIDRTKCDESDDIFDIMHC